MLKVLLRLIVVWMSSLVLMRMIVSDLLSVSYLCFGFMLLMMVVSLVWCFSVLWYCMNRYSLYSLSGMYVSGCVMNLLRFVVLVVGW